MIKNNEIIFAIINFSNKNRKKFEEEFEKLCNYYKNNQKKLIEDILELKASITQDDYYSEFMKNKSDDLLSDLNNEKNFIFNERFFIDSLQKIHEQIKIIPNYVTKETAKIFYYNLSEEKTNDSNFIVSLFEINIINFYELYYTTNN